MIAITGATGHLGQTLLRQMRSRGDVIAAAVRETSDQTLLEGYCDRVHITTLDNPDGLATAFDGAHTVIHSAALIDIRRGSLDAMHRVNVAGTDNVMKACKLAGVRRLVYVGSIEAFDLTASRRPIRKISGLPGGMR
jgi:dihydroflavonol-4-reductase